MILRKRNILIVSPEPWEHMFVSKHDYAIQLARNDNRVFFLNPPASDYNIRKTKYENVTSVDYKGFPKGLHLLPKVLRKISQKRIFEKLQTLLSIQFDIIWSFDNSVFYDFDALPSTLLKISHIVDLNMDYQFKRASSQANICFSTTQTILKKQKMFNEKSFFINHGFLGIDLELERGRSPLIDSIKTNRLKIGYAGNLDLKYLDVLLIGSAIKKFADCDFYFAGSGSKKWVGDNVHYLGMLDKPLLMEFYRRMDILIIAYRAEEFQDQVSNPHKLMEYLSSGTPIVSTYTAEYEHLSDLIAMSKTSDRWVGELQEVINNLELWNDEIAVQKRKSIAADNSYEVQIERISGYLNMVE